MIHAAITGVGGYVPDYILNNDELSRMVDTNDEWITSRVGIKERHIMKEPGGTSVMGAKAVAQLLEKTNTNPEDVQVVICATTTPDHVFPSCASMCAEKNNIKNAFAFDLSAACCGFLFVLETGANYIASGKYKKIIVIAGEKMSAITDYTDRTTCPLFGDGVGAVMLEPCEEGNFGLMDSILHTDGIGLPHLQMKAGGSAYPASIETVTNREHFVYQEGQPVFKAAVTHMADVSAEIMQRNNLTADDIAWFIPHQANLRIIDAAARRMNLSHDKVLINIERYGNTSAGSIPLCLWDFEKKFKKGDNIVIAAFGAGFTWGSAWIRWAYDGDKV